MLVKMKRALVIINGYPVPKHFLNYFWQKNDIHICTDGSFHSVFKAGFTPDFVIGDIDSLQKEKLPENMKNRIIQQSNQDSTDLQKVFNYLKKKSIKEIDILGVIGSRVDHLIFNISLLKLYYADFQRIRFWTPSESIELVLKEKIIKAEKGTRISFFPLFDRVEKLSSTGLEYELSEESLDFGGCMSISNRIRKTPARLNWMKGMLVIFLEHKLNKT